MNHWLILPILVPAVVAPLQAFSVRNDIVLARVFSVGSTTALVLLGCLQLGFAADGSVRTYSLGDWPAPFGIVLVLDRLAAIMLLLTALLGLFVLLYAINGADRKGEHFHPLFQFQLMGLNGAFLTGDLFNLFVFFEVLLIASYGLMIHGGGAARMRAGVQYVVMNLVGSSAFLIALGLIYGVAGTLNMADLAAKVPEIEVADRSLFYCGAAILLAVFAFKSAILPLHFWLPGTYAHTSGPVAALFAILTKVGVYAILRVFVLTPVGMQGSGGASVIGWLMPAASLTMLAGMLGVVAARSLGQQAAFAALASVGTLMIAVAGFNPQAETAALYYLIHSTLATAALFLLVDAVLIRRTGYGDALTAGPRFESMGFMGGMFFVAVVAVLGLPPLSGFVGKLLILDAAAAGTSWPWIWIVILGTSVLGLIGFAMSGSLIFWKSLEVPGELDARESFPLALPMVAIGLILSTLVLLTGFSGPVLAYLDATVEQMFDSQRYIQAVLANSVQGAGDV